MGSYGALRTAFDSAKHPRDRDGRFGHTASGSIPKPRSDKAVLSPKAYDALRPASSFDYDRRDETLAELGETPDGKVLADLLFDWQDGPGIAEFRSKVGDYANGRSVDPESEQRAQILLNAIRHAPPELSPPVLHRGLAVQGSPESVLEQYKPGSEVNLNLTSFTSYEGTAQEFAGKGALPGSGKTGVMMELVGEKNTLPIQNLSETIEMFYEEEFVAAGKYKVVSAETDAKGGVKLKIQQVGLL